MNTSQSQRSSAVRYEFTSGLPRLRLAAAGSGVGWPPAAPVMSWDISHMPVAYRATDVSIASPVRSRCESAAKTAADQREARREVADRGRHVRRGGEVGAVHLVREPRRGPHLRDVVARLPRQARGPRSPQPVARAQTSRGLRAWSSGTEMPSFASVSGRRRRP